VLRERSYRRIDEQVWCPLGSLERLSLGGREHLRDIVQQVTLAAIDGFGPKTPGACWRRGQLAQSFVKGRIDHFFEGRAGSFPDVLQHRGDVVIEA
jgi:hypothetical protein